MTTPTTDPGPRASGAAPRPLRRDADVVIVGAGIVGLATAWALAHQRPDLRLTLVEKEPQPATHQSGHNSGVIHSGLYYKPGSDKARLVAAGRAELLEFCDARGIHYERCGKVVVATTEEELPRLATLAARGQANGVTLERIDRARLRELEPWAEGLAALHVPDAGIIRYRDVCEVLVDELSERGHLVKTAWPVTSIEAGDAEVVVAGPRGEVRASLLVNCAGLHSDRVAALAGADTAGVRIMAFRGEYHELRPDRRYLCRNLLYPVPDPAFPFLGVHLTRLIDGEIHVGPNAVPALRREGYRWRDVDRRDLAEVLGSRRTYRLARKHWRTGLGEIHRSLRKAAFVEALQKLCPAIQATDLLPSAAGVRAQAIDAAGNLLDDFAFADGPRSVHVINAPSPAATASFAIGRTVAARVLARYDG
jgi:L-2-hydroxyglutarate oxidase